MYNAFLNKRIETEEFVKLYLHLMEVNDDQYEDTVKEMIVTYPEYKSVVLDKIASIYASTYTTQISDSDIAFFFKKIHQMRLSLQDERFNEVVTSLKEETDRYHSIIHSITEKILERRAEDMEIETHIVYFRDHNEDNLRPEIRLEDELYESLEYHDILKNMIVSQCEKHLNRKLNRSELFKMLQFVLALEDKYVKRDPEKVFASLTNYRW